MKLPPSAAVLHRNHVFLELERLDRMYLNAYVPQLTSEDGIASLFRGYLGDRFATIQQAGPMTEVSVRSPSGILPDPGLVQPITAPSSRECWRARDGGHGTYRKPCCGTVPCPAEFEMWPGA